MVNFAGRPIIRTFGRITNPDGSRIWVVVQTDSLGNDDLVWVTTLLQVIQLNLNESPFFAQYGLPAQQSVMQQVFPDYYMALTQQVVAPYFASLIISKVSSATPTYNVFVTLHSGVQVKASVSIPS